MTRREYIYPAIIVAVCLSICLPQLNDNEMWHSDSSRHTMNGVLFMEWMAGLPASLGKPVQQADEFYRQYSVLSLPYHPPGFPVLEAVLFRIGGISAAAARTGIMLMFLFMATGMYYGVRRMFGAETGLWATLLFVTLPYTGLLARSVLLEIPVLAFFIPAATAFFLFLRKEGYGWLYISLVSAVVGVYFKQTAVSAFFLFAIALLTAGRTDLVRDKKLLAGLGAAAAAIIPLVVATLLYSPTLLEQAAGSVGRMSRFSWEGLTFYIRQLPLQFSPAVIVLGTIFCGMTVRRLLQDRKQGKTAPGDGDGDRFVFSWIIACFVFFTLVSVKYPRHTVYWMPAWCIGSAAFALRLRIRGVRIGRYLLLAVIALQFRSSWIYQRPTVDGPRKAADTVVAGAPSGNVLYAGSYNGNFAFAVRARYPDWPFRIFRVSRDFLDIPIMQHFGYTEKIKTAEGISRFLSDNRIRYLVLEQHHALEGAAYRILPEMAETAGWEHMAQIPLAVSDDGYRANSILVFRIPEGNGV